MKKSILFASGIALLSFAGCDDGSAKINELQTQLDQAKQERDAASLSNQEQLTYLGTTYQYKVDSLQYIIDSLTAPKGSVPSKPKPSKPTTSTTTTTTPTKTEEPKKAVDVKGQTGTKIDVGQGTDTSSKKKKVDVGQKP
ncbi:hypothetical protein BH09BAC1_BH09BAC1_09880 [soil metagenome]